MTLPDLALAREGLAHARWKIEWAKQHISGVEGLVNAVINECKTLLRVQPNPNEGTVTVIFGPTQSLPVALPLHIGDAVHALNSAIDYLWSGLARSFSLSIGAQS